MLSYHLFFNQISIIARLNIGNQEARLDKTDPELDWEAQIKILTSKVQMVPNKSARPDPPSPELV